MTTVTEQAVVIHHDYKLGKKIYAGTYQTVDEASAISKVKQVESLKQLAEIQTDQRVKEALMKLTEPT